MYSEVAAYEFTTLTTVPGCIKYKGAKIQLLDLPGIIEGAKDGKGRGRQVIAVARTCNLIFMVLDVLKPLHHKKLLEHELEGFGIRLNQKPPNINYRRKDKGGINLNATVAQSELDLDTVTNDNSIGWNDLIVTSVMLISRSKRYCPNIKSITLT